MTSAQAYPDSQERQSELAAVQRMLDASRGAFSLSVAICNSVPVRDDLIAELRASHGLIAVVSIPQGAADAFQVVRDAVGESEPPGICVVDLEATLSSANKEFPLLRALNAARELWAKHLACPLLLWVPEYVATLLARHAPDLWAWKSHEFDFVSETAVGTAGVHDVRGEAVMVDSLTADQKKSRIVELERRISEAGKPPEPGLAHHVLAWLGELGILHSHPLDQIRWFEAALAAARELKDRQAEGSQLGNLGLAYAGLGEVRRAIEHYEQALAIHREMGNRQAKGAALSNLGVAYLRVGEVRRGVELWEQALAIQREIGDRRGEGNSLGNLGLAYADLGQAHRAVEYLERALAIHREVGDRHGEGAGLGNLGMAYADLGEARRAIEYCEQALAIRREIGDRRGEGADLGNLGSAHAALGELGRAIEYHEQAIAIAREIGDRHGHGTRLGNLGNAYAALGEPGRAVECYEQALAIRREIGDRRGEGTDLWNMALALDRLERREDAVRCCEESLRLLAQVEDPNAAKVREALDEWRGEG